MKIEEEIKQKKFEDDYQRVLVNLAFTNHWLAAKSKPLFKEYELTMQQYNVLRILRGRSPEACSAGEVKEVMLDKSPDLTRLLDRLVNKQLVSRQVCDMNRRKVDLKITNKGLKLLDKMAPAVKGTFDLSPNLTKKEARELSNLLDKLRG